MNYPERQEITVLSADKLDKICRCECHKIDVDCFCGGCCRLCTKIYIDENGEINNFNLYNAINPPPRKRRRRNES